MDQGTTATAPVGANGSSGVGVRQRRTCKKCGSPSHDWIWCMQTQCDKCTGFGHIGSHCASKVSHNNGGSKGAMGFGFLPQSALKAAQRDNRGFTREEREGEYDEWFNVI